MSDDVLRDGDVVALRACEMNVLTLITANAPQSRLLDQITETLEELIPGGRAAVLLYDPATRATRVGSAPSLPSLYVKAVGGMSGLIVSGKLDIEACLRYPMVIDSVATSMWAEYQELADRLKITSFWSSPIRGKEGTVGVFVVYHAAAFTPGTREHRLIDRLTFLASVLIEHPHLFGSLVATEQRFREASERAASLIPMQATAPGVTPRSPAPRAMEIVENSFPYTDFEEEMARQQWARVRECLREGHPIASCETGGERQSDAGLARLAAGAAQQAKRELLSAISDRSRMPVEAITGFADMLRQLDFTPERSKQVLRVEDVAPAVLSGPVEHQRRWPAALLGSATDARPVDLRLLVHDVVEFLGPVAARSSMSLECVGASGVVLADYRRLRQLLINVVASLVRSSRTGTVIRIECGHDLSEVTFAVAGHRVTVVTDRSGADAGDPVGYTIAIEQARAMGGSLQVGGPENSQVTVRLPAMAAATSRTA